MALSDYLTIRPMAFGVVDRLKPRIDDTVMIAPRNSGLGAGSLSFLGEAGDHPAISKVYVAVRDLETLKTVFEPLEPRLDRLDVAITPVEIDSYEFVSSMAECSLLFLCNQYDIPNYRLFSQNRKRDIVRIHHGILTKAYGNTTVENQSKQARRRRKNLPYPNKQKYIENINIDVQSVESDVELFYRVAAEGRSLSVFRKYGYPRFDRIRKLIAGSHDPIVPASTADRLSDDGPYRILYAPTHKDDAYSTTVFPFPDFDLDRLREFLRDRGIELYVRMHFSEDDETFYDRIVDNETIFRAGQPFSPSPIEILPSFDMLVTDYSSIYVDYLPVDGPIVFVKDDHDTFRSKRGFAFDYEEYFPGRKVEDFEAFRSHLVRCVEERTDGHADDRTFVRRTFLPGREETFLDHVVENHLE